MFASFPACAIFQFCLSLCSHFIRIRSESNCVQKLDHVVGLETVLADFLDLALR